jgi:hypothetical protein
VTNPKRVLDGETPLPVNPLAVRTPFWSRLAGVFR